MSVAHAQRFDWKRLFQSFAVIILAGALLSALADDADARKRKRKATGYVPPYAEFVTDVNSGRTLRAVNADAPRFPASITKVMTLYVLFEQLERGRITMNTRFEVSAFAAGQSPSKLGMRPGSSIRVEDAINALITKSANDVAVTVAENIAGDQDNFARMMTRKARALGMSRTTFRNASGLPNPKQVTTARDLSKLGIAMKQNFPQYYHLFSQRAFAYRGDVLRNHNRLLGRVEGVDGIKTGYTRASGFNLLTSAKSGNREIIAVVLGGRSGRARDGRVTQLVMNHLPRATTQVASARRRLQLAAVDTDTPVETRAPVNDASSTQLALLEQPVETPRQKRARAAVVAAAGSIPTEQQAQEAILSGPAVLKGKKRAKAQLVAAAEPEPREPEMRWVASETPAGGKKRRKAAVVAAATPDDTPVTNATADRPAAIEQDVAEASQAKARPASGWVIQLAAAESEEQAKAILSRAQKRQGKVLASAQPFTETVKRGDSTLWRARFGGFEGTEAQAACSALKRSGFDCIAKRV
jgi:D-alanyl-D-alanine carboxypeptidase